MEIVGILEAGIGLVLVFLTLSLICSAWTGLITHRTGLRGENLHRVVSNLFFGRVDLANELYANAEMNLLHSNLPKSDIKPHIIKKAFHWLVVIVSSPVLGLSPEVKGKRRWPSHIEKERFAKAFLSFVLDDTIDRFQLAPSLVEYRLLPENIIKALDKHEDKAAVLQAGSLSTQQVGEHIAEILQRFWHRSNGQTDQFIKHVEDWYKESTDRSIGWFKKRLAPRIFFSGLAIAIAVNANTITIVSKLSSDSEIRAELVQLASQKTKEGAVDCTLDVNKDNILCQIPALKSDVFKMTPLLGWTDESRSFNWWIYSLLGWVLTAFAISMGAPFWFDILNKLVNLRSSMNPETGQGAIPGTGPSKTENAPNAAPAGTRTVAGMLPDQYVTGMPGFKPFGTSFEPDNAYWLASAAQLAYLDAATVESQCKARGLFHFNFLDENNTQCFIAANDEIIIVSFRGTEPKAPADFITDAQFKLTSIGWIDAIPQAHIHKGFLDALDDVWPLLVTEQRKLSDRPRTIWFTGHSLGGALAVLAAARFQLQWTSEKRTSHEHLSTLRTQRETHEQTDEIDEHINSAIRNHVASPSMGGIYTIGQPAVGNEAMSMWLNQQFHGQLYRTINNRDIVPRMPPEAMGYEHAGETWYFDSFARLHKNPSSWLKKFDALVFSPDQFKNISLETVKDHAAEDYVGLLDGARKKLI